MSLSLLEKYIPTNQKSLFHKDVVAHIRKWISDVDYALQNKTDQRKILLLKGPCGCGKSATMSVLLKAFHVISIDTNDIWSTKRIEEKTWHLSDAKKKSLRTLSTPKTPGKCNIVLVDNLELCEGHASSLLNHIHAHHNIPIVVMYNSDKVSEIKIDEHLRKITTELEFGQPSLLELNKLVKDINAKENLNLDPSNITALVTYSQHDTRQLLLALDQWKRSTRACMKMFLASLQLKDKDIDLSLKLDSICNKQDYNFDEIFSMTSSEPMVITNHIYQNYITHASELDQNTYNVVEYLSFGNIIQQKMFEEQFWELYDCYNVISCVAPTFYLKNAYQGSNTQHVVTAFKDISLNYHTSLLEVKRIVYENFGNKNLNDLLDNNNINHVYITCMVTCRMLANLLNDDASRLVDFFESNKKGKNVTKKEKLILLETARSNKVMCCTFNHLVSLICAYRLFEADTDDIILNINNINNINSLGGRDDHVNKISLKILRRFLNIFSLHHMKKFSSTLENALQYEILCILANKAKSRRETLTKKTNDINNFIVDLSSIWKLNS
jgi:hypothetical protein